VALQYTRLSEITDDIDDARVYGGIHFRFDQEAGACQGTRVGRFVSTHNLQRKQRHFFFGAAPWGDDEPRSAEAPQSFGFGRHRAPQHCGR
jgi:hypothetical protein